MKTRKLFYALFALALAGGPVWAGNFQTGANDPGNTVTFRISAPLETIVGTSAGGISGHFHLDPNDVKGSSKARFEVDVASFETGIDLRDEHFRDNFLHTGQYPKAVFTLDRVVEASKNEAKPGAPVEIEAEGTFELHGVKRTERVRAWVTHIEGDETTKGVLPGNLVAIDARFRIKLADYDIERPQMLVLKVGEEVDINVVARLSDAQQLAAGAACNPCGGAACNPCGGAACNPCGGAACNPCGGAACNPCGL